MSKREEFNSALKDAMREKDQLRVSTLRLIMAALKDRDIAARTQGSGEPVGEGEILSMLQSMIKQRQESAATYRQANRPELAEREEAEIAVIDGFLPRQLSESEAEDAVVKIIGDTGAASIKDMGKVMAEMKARYAGQMDMTRASALVKQKLAG